METGLIYYPSLALFTSAYKHVHVHKPSPAMSTQAPVIQIIRYCSSELPPLFLLLIYMSHYTFQTCLQCIFQYFLQCSVCQGGCHWAFAASLQPACHLGPHAPLVAHSDNQGDYYDVIAVRSVIGRPSRIISPPSRYGSVHHVGSTVRFSCLVTNNFIMSVAAERRGPKV